MDKDYIFKINPELDLSEQNISQEANAILVSLFRDYFATENQNEMLNKLLRQNQEKLENVKRERYTLDNIFKNRKNEFTNEVKEEQALVKIKNEKWYKKFFSFLKEIF